MEKRCYKCNLLRSLDQFYKSPNRLDGVSSKCKECYKDYYKKNKDYINKQKRQYYRQNKDKSLERNKKWRKDNPNYCKSYYKSNKEKILAYRKQRRNENSQIQLSACVSSGISKSLNNQKNGRHWETIVDYTIEDLMYHLESQFKEGMSWENYGLFGWHIDHKIPKCMFTTKQIKECWALDNLQPLWAEENLIKNNKLL